MIPNIEDVYRITFIVDQETQIVLNINVSTLKSALGYL